MRPLVLLPPDDDSREEALATREATAMQTQSAQVYAANTAVGLPAEAFLAWPWPALAAVMGEMAPGVLGFLCAASGGGKTSFLLSLLRRLFLAGRHVYYAGLESRPHILRTQWACLELGMDPGDVLSGRAQHSVDWPARRERLRREFMAQVKNRAMNRVRFAPFPFLDLIVLDAMFREAHDFGADMIVIDHVDHIDGGRGNLYESSVAVTKRLLTLTQDYGARVICASQTNLSGAGADPLRFHRPVRREHVKNGNHKIEVADWMLGLYRPLRASLAKETVARWRDGAADLSSLLEPGVTALNVMKHRLYGSREGQRVRLGFARGEVVDAQEPREVRSTWLERETTL